MLRLAPDAGPLSAGHVLYAAEPGEGVMSVPLDRLTALYHRRSGQTHLVAVPVPDVLAALGGRALDVPAILDALGIDEDAESRAALTARLEEMVETGLVARL
jgi:PqqD family protein of HPr-rel-A system